MATRRKRTETAAPPAPVAFEPTPEQRAAAYDDLTRVDFRTYALRAFEEQHGHPFDEMPFHAELWRFFYDLEYGELLRGAISWPPRFGKSWLAACFLAFTLSKYGACKFIVATYAERLSVIFSASVIQILTLPKLRTLFPLENTTISADASSREYFETLAGGALRACSPGAAVTGLGAGGTAPPDPVTGKRPFQGLLLIDDLLLSDSARSAPDKAKAWQYIVGTLLSRRNGDHVPVVAIGQRLAVDDPLGHLLDGELGGEPFRHLRIEAYDEENEVATWEARKSAKELREMRVAQPWVYETQYQGRPFVQTGALIPTECINQLDKPVSLSSEAKYSLGVDLAGSVGPKADWSVFVLMAFDQGQCHVVRVERFRAPVVEVERRLFDAVMATPLGTVVQLQQDPAVAGKAWAEAIHKLLLPTGREVRSATAFAGGRDGSKATRIMPFAGHCGRGLVSLFPGPWNAEYLSELQQFDAGRWDDQVDATASAFGAANHLLLTDSERKRLEEEQRVREAWSHFGDPDWQAVYEGFNVVRWERSKAWLERQERKELEAGAPERERAAAEAEKARVAALSPEEAAREEGQRRLAAATAARDDARRRLRDAEARDEVQREIARQAAARPGIDPRAKAGIEAMEHMGYTFIVRDPRAVECRQPPNSPPRPWPDSAMSAPWFSSPLGQAACAAYLAARAKPIDPVAVPTGPSDATLTARVELERLEAERMELEQQWGALPADDSDVITFEPDVWSPAPCFLRQMQQEIAESAARDAAEARRARGTIGIVITPRFGLRGLA